MATQFLGLVSNCFAAQRKQGTPLPELIKQAQSKGFNYIELRQTHIGEPYETGPKCVPNPEQIGKLATQFPDVGFNLAVALPILSGELSTDDEIFQQGCKTAAALAKGAFKQPFLRVVDTYTVATAFEKVDEARVTASLKTLLAELRKVAGKDATLVIENCKQDFAKHMRVANAASASCEDIKLCWDPCNLKTQFKAEDSEARAAQIQDANTIGMMHLKQSVNGDTIDTIADGDVDWTAQVKRVNDLKYKGPILFEVKSTDTLWTKIDEGLKYVRGLGLAV